jgi:hypothetical protein
MVKRLLALGALAALVAILREELPAMKRELRILRM